MTIAEPRYDLTAEEKERLFHRLRTREATIDDLFQMIEVELGEAEGSLPPESGPSKLPDGTRPLQTDPWHAGCCVMRVRGVYLRQLRKLLARDLP